MKIHNKLATYEGAWRFSSMCCGLRKSVGARCKPRLAVIENLAGSSVYCGLSVVYLVVPLHSIRKQRSSERDYSPLNITIGSLLCETPGDGIHLRVGHPEVPLLGILKSSHNPHSSGGVPSNRSQDRYSTGGLQRRSK